MLFFFLLYTHIPITFPVSDLSPVVHASGAAPWAIKMPPGTGVILAELLPETVCT